MSIAVDHHLGRVDAIVAALSCVIALALAVGGGGKRVAPADVIPIVDVERQADDVLLAHELAHEGVGRRTGRAALAR